MNVLNKKQYAKHTKIFSIMHKMSFVMRFSSIEWQPSFKKLLFKCLCSLFKIATSSYMFELSIDCGGKNLELLTYMSSRKTWLQIKCIEEV